MSQQSDATCRIGTLSDVPINVSGLSKLPNQPLAKVSIGLDWNKNKQHLKISNFQPPEYYEEYFMTASYSSVMQALQKFQSQKLFKFASGSNHGALKVVEIGCGDGSFLGHLSKNFSMAVGIEASKKFAAHARSAGFTILEGYVSKDGVPLSEDRFDAFASRQVFEHLEDPLGCLLGIKKILKPGAVGLIEVPNGYKSFRESRFYDFFPDHINYFSINSLVDLASNAGFNVLECGEAFGWDYLELWLKNDQHQNWFNAMIDRRNDILIGLQNWMQLQDSLGHKCAIFGCGAKAMSLLSAISEKGLLESVSYAIDSDPFKWGKYIPNSSIEILDINDPRLLDVKSVIVLSLSYREEAGAIVRRCLSGCTSISTIDESGSIVDIFP